MVQINEFRTVNESSRRLWEKDRTKFIKKHQWILKADHLSEHFQKNVKLDIFNQEIIFETFTTHNEKASAQKWVKNMKDGKYKGESITMVHYDSKGEEIAQKVFHGLKVFGHKCYFDYEEKETAVDTVYVKYEKEVELKTPVVDEVQLMDDKIIDPKMLETWGTPMGGIWPTLPNLDKNFKLTSHKEDMIKQRDEKRARKAYELRKTKEKTLKVKKPLNLCTRKRLP